MRRLKHSRSSAVAEKPGDASCHSLRHPDHSRSLKISPFDRSPTSSYWRSIVTMALSCVISEIKRDIGRKSPSLIPPPCIRHPVSHPVKSSSDGTTHKRSSWRSWQLTSDTTWYDRQVSSCFQFELSRGVDSQWSSLRQGAMCSHWRVRYTVSNAASYLVAVVQTTRGTKF